GANWVNLSGGEPGGIFRSPCDVVVQFENPNVILIADGTTGSGSGKFWKATNGGINWTLINTVSGSEIPMIANSSLDLNLIYHTTWPSGSFWKSTDMGSSFQNLNRSGSLWASDIAKDDPNAVAYDEYGLNSWISLDGGSTFTLSIPVGSSPAAGILFYDKSTLLFQHGGGIHRLAVNYNVTPVTGIHGISGDIPKSFSLGQNYPNPFNPMTHFGFRITDFGLVQLIVYNAEGKEIAKLVNRELSPGTYEAAWDGTNKLSRALFS